jgi:putative thioredoxin
MMASDFIVDVNEADFEYQVIAYSKNIPVVVDFWAEWCSPCKILGPMLERLALEAQGSFRLAKVNVDENPNLAIRYNVRSIPTVKAFQDGGVVAELVGLQPEPRLRDFIQDLAPSQSSLALEKAFSLLEMQEPQSAEEAFRSVLDQSPQSTAAMLGLAKSLLLQGEIEEGRYLLDNFPASKEYSASELLRPLASALEREENEVLELDEVEPDEASYRNALRLVTHGNIPAALDGLLDVLRQDKQYRDGEARKVFLALLELLGENNPLARQYRNELASVLF